MTLRWIADRLKRGTWAHETNRLYHVRIGTCVALLKSSLGWCRSGCWFLILNRFLTVNFEVRYVCRAVVGIYDPGA